MFKRYTAILAASIFTLGSYAQSVPFQSENGVCTFGLADGGRMRLEFPRPDIVHVAVSHSDTFDSGTGVCVYEEKVQGKKSCLKKQKRLNGNEILLTTDSLQLQVDLHSGAITYMDNKGNVLLRENASAPHPSELKVTEKVIFDESTRRVEKTIDGEKERMDVLRRDTVGKTWKYSLQLQLQQGEALYGLGSHMEDFMNLRGKKQYLAQHNLKAMVPVLNSTAGYGLLIDAGCAMVFDDARTDGNTVLDVEATQALNYYFMKGRTMDATVAAYRWLTGEVSMMPLWVFGYTQSKERYYSQDDLLNTLREFRRRHIPIDCIVQDWNYWKDGSWGTMSMEAKRYPDKKAMADAVHDMNARLMISIWPNMSNSPQHDEFQQRGFFFPGQNVYDAFRPEARDLYWSYADREFFQNGFDAWWCDSSEPLDGDWGNRGREYGLDSHAERWQLQKDKLESALGKDRSMLFSLYHSKGIYDHQIQTPTAKRVVNLTRSSYAGEQRYGTIVWNGDTYASWKQFKQMIPAGLNYMATGCNYWTVDAGCFFTRKGWAWFYCGEFPEGCKDPAYREFYVRMLQYATFLPVMRSHGSDTPREPWQFGEPGTPFYDAIMQCINLRYRLLPYSYSMGAAVTNHDYTMARCLSFDFPADQNVHDIKDQFMYGPAFLVAPVTDASAEGPQGSTTRKVYLPKGANWYDYHTNQLQKGGQTISVKSSISQMPLFVRAGSIVPMSQVVEYSSLYDKQPWDVYVYPGADAEFEVYQDAGDSHVNDMSSASTFKLKWNDKKRTLTIETRKGQNLNVDAIPITVRLVGGSSQQVTYSGKKCVVKF